jgi:Nucleoside-diphosphate-sugar epimerases
MKTRKKIIIFGATGNTGSYLLDYALKYFNLEEYEIIASGRRQTAFFEKRGIEYYSVDLTIEQDFKKLPVQNVYAVMLLSAQIPSYMHDYQPRRYVDSIIIGAYNVLEFCRKNKVDRILYTNTSFDIWLYSHDIAFKPDLPRNFSYTGDHAMYVICKNTAIEFIEHYHQEYGLKKFIFRLPTIYNYSPYPFYFPNGIKTMRPIYQMINKAKNSEPLEIWGDPNYAKDMVHVNDFSQMLCKAVEVNRKEGYYNVGTGIPVTLEEQIRTIVSIFSPSEHPSPIIYRPDKPSTGGVLMDITNAKKELGYEPQYNCRKLFEDFKKEMELNKFKELRIRDI